jgi:hypothetical protein
MIVTMRPGIRPLCTDRHKLMNFAQFGEPTQLTVKAYKCDEAGCTRAYNSSLGYFDLVEDRPLMGKSQQKCPQDDTPVFLESIAGPDDIYRCAQIGCDHSQRFKR